MNCNRLTLSTVTMMLAGLATASGQAQTAPTRTTVIHAGTLIAEPGKPPKSKQSIVIEDGRIKSIVDGFVPGDIVVDLSRKFVLPGLIDMHTHVTAVESLDLKAPTRWVSDRILARQAITVLDAVPVVKKILQRGFTTIRNLGDPASVTYDLRNAIAAGKVEGPRMLVSEPQFTTSAGDLQASSFGMRREIEPFLANRGQCDGVEDCSRAVREEVGRGADVIKFRLSDLSASDARIDTVERQDEINAVIQTAHRLGRTVAVHTAGLDRETLMAVLAGADTLEHGPQSATVLAAMKKSGTSFTPTLSVYAYFDPILKKLGVTRDYYSESRSSVADAKRLGVRILYGTDLTPLTADLQSTEFAELVSAGLTPTEALMAATGNPAAALRMQDKIGSIASGRAADIIAVDEDPLIDIRAMEAVTFVMKDGRQIETEVRDEHR